MKFIVRLWRVFYWEATNSFLKFNWFLFCLHWVSVAMRGLSSCCEQEVLFAVGPGPFIAVASLVQSSGSRTFMLQQQHVGSVVWILGSGAQALESRGIFLDQGSNRVSCIGRQTVCLLTHQGSPGGYFCFKIVFLKLRQITTCKSNNEKEFIQCSNHGHPLRASVLEAGHATQDLCRLVGTQLPHPEFEAWREWVSVSGLGQLRPAVSLWFLTSHSEGS